MPQLQLNTVILGDCLEKMRDIPDASIDCIICDLPYQSTQNSWDVAIPMEDLWTEWKRICKPGAAVILFTQQPFTTTVAAKQSETVKD